MIRNTAKFKLLKNARVRASSGFTLLELLVVIAIVGILAGLLLSVLNRAKSSAQSTACKNNLKQLQLAWQTYADDNNGFIAGNKVGYISGYYQNVDGWVLGNAKRDQSDQNIKSGKLWTYTGSNRIYHCPTDRSKVLGHPQLTRFRSYQLDGFLNVSNFGNPSGYYGERGVLRRDFDALDPANNFVFADVSEASIEDGGFSIGTYGDLLQSAKSSFYWVSQPGERHGRGANLSFLDGHVRGHRWLFTPKVFISPESSSPPINALDREDLIWLLDRSRLGQYRTRVLGLP